MERSYLDKAAAFIAAEVSRRAWAGLCEGRASDYGYPAFTYLHGPVNAGKDDYRDIALQVYLLIDEEGKQQ